MALKTFGKLQAGTPDSTEFGFYGFGGGLNIKSAKAPQLLADNELTIAQDGYLTPNGAFNLRNGMAKFGTAITGTGALYIARFYQTIVNNAPITPTATILGTFNGTLYNITSSGHTSLGSVGGTAGAQPTSWVRFQDADDPNHTSGLTDVIVICTGVGGPYIWDGTNLYTPSGWADAAGARYCAIVNGILWFGGIANYPNQIFGSGDGIIASFETLPAYRNFVMSSYVSGLQAQGTGATATLIIGRITGISVLYGTGPSTFFLQDVPFQDGVVSAMCSANGVVYMLGHNAFYSFDAVTVPNRVSDKVEPWILNDPYVSGSPMTANRGLSWACVYNNRVHLGYCSNSNTPNAILCYDLILNAWTVLSPAPGLASMVLLDGPFDPDPYVAYVGSATTGQVYEWDYTPASTSSPVLDDATPVLAQVQTKYFKIGVPGTNKALTRLYPEFQITGLFSGTFQVSTNYGSDLNEQMLSTNIAPKTGTLIWDVGLWDVNTWAGNQTVFVTYGAPDSRLDYPMLQADSFAFGFQMNQALSPWIWAGATGVFQQQGRT